MPPRAEADLPTLTERLRTATHDVHVRLEQQLDIMRPDLTMPQYVHQLGRWLGFCRTWESAGASAFGGRLRIFFDDRRKTSLLVNDLLRCGVSSRSIARLARCGSQTLDFANPSAALGTLYVIEGSTLGGAYIAKHVQARLGLTPADGLSFFSSYGNARAARWSETKMLLNAPPVSIIDERTIVAASATFEFLSRWLTASNETVRQPYTNWV